MFLALIQKQRVKTIYRRDERPLLKIDEGDNDYKKYCENSSH